MAGDIATRRTPLSPLDVLHALWRGAGGGAERHVIDISGEFVRRGIRTGILYFTSDSGAADELDRLGILHRSFGLHHGGDPRGPFLAASMLRDLRPRIIHDHVSTPWLRALLRRSPARRIVATEHGHLLWLDPTKPGLRHRIEIAGARKTDLYIAPSQAIARAVHEHYRFPTERIRVIPHGIRSSFPDLSPETRAVMRRELGIDEGDIAILFVGRLDETKGILDLWAAFTQIADVRRDAIREGTSETPHGATGRRRLVLLIAGTGELAGNLQRLVAENGLEDRVRLLGFRNDVDRLLAAADIFILPARHEAFGIVLLEAMTAGLPIVATRTGGIPEIVVNGITGILAEPNDPESLGRALLELADDGGKRQSLGRAGYDRWARSFTLDRCVEATLEAYRWSQNRQP